MAKKSRAVRIWAASPPTWHSHVAQALGLRKKGHQLYYYVYVVESARVDGQPRIVFRNRWPRSPLPDNHSPHLLS
jgi:hypothetical protein